MCYSPKDGFRVAPMTNRAPQATSSTVSAESDRVRGVYVGRREVSDGPLDLYGLCMHQERQEILLRFFRELGLASLAGLRILDVGCGSGGQLRRMIDFGAEPANCFGIDLFRKSLAGGRTVNPNLHFVEGSGEQLPFPSSSFDLAFQFTVFTSVLDAAVRRSMAAEILRVLRPGGHFVWYDFAYSNPRNPNVRGIGRREISELLSGFRLAFRRVTLAPPIGRAAVKFSPSIYRVLNTIPLLRSHYFCFAQKPAQPNSVPTQVRRAE
jgi:ubiquinone/menaquinone biosynthesis C-methylase UbiE